MNSNEILQKATVLLAPWTQTTTTPDLGRLDVSLDTSNLLAAVKALQEGRWGYLAAISGLDLGIEKGHIEVLYHFCSGPAVLTLRVLTPRDSAMVPSLCDVIPSASFLERELIEMLGVTVTGTPNADHLFLPDDWPQGVYPLRKDFQVSEAGR